jgi:hypothetical protein
MRTQPMRTNFEIKICRQNNLKCDSASKYLENLNFTSRCRIASGVSAPLMRRYMYASRTYFLDLVHMNPWQLYVPGKAIVAGQKLSRLVNKTLVLFT